MREPLTRLDRIIRNERYQEALSQIDAAEQNRKFCRHTPEHFFDTARIMYIIALEEHLSVSKEMIYAAALLHDIGRAEEYRSRMPHEQASAQLAKKILTECGYTEEETTAITDAILAHRNEPLIRQSELALLLYRADKLSRRCFSCKAYEECYWSESRKNHFIVY